MESIDYRALLQRAIRGVILGALSCVEENGLPLGNHFVIRFSTVDPKVEIPNFLRAKYPEEMTIVIQHWFDDLMVDKEGFGITLNFQDSPQRLYVPIRAVKLFSDPKAKFGFCLTDGAPEISPELLISQKAAVADKPEPRGEKDETGTKVVSLDKFRKLD